ncbi:MAG: amidase [Acidiferrobacteraceae bacterium]|nr:amidase [Acidiferrobacteraceae bacterium]|tara:strand:- start:2121 stop:3530 length:1410 start_codon:yes stop_codon:yes gene_type:complete
MTATELWQFNACYLAKGIRDGSFTCEEVMLSVVERISNCNQKLNAIVYDYSDHALSEAIEADKSLAKGGQIGALYGVPVTVKTNIDVKGQPTPNGIRAYESIIAEEDSPVVRHLKNAGAIIIGRTNTPEFSMRLTTDNPLHGRTVNPWDQDASPGGSSGGAGVAAAMGFGPIHHGNDIGGSLRFPASFCGVTTIKPTFGRTPNYVGSSSTSERGMLSQLIASQGVICREVSDVRLATKIISNADSRDPLWMPVTFDSWPNENSVQVAMTHESYDYAIHPQIVEGLDRVAGYLSDAGYSIAHAETPSIYHASQCWFKLLGSEIREFMAPLAAEEGSPAIQKILEWHLKIVEVADAEAYRIGIKERTAETRRWNLFLDHYPLVLTPYFMRPAPRWDCDVQSSEQYKDICRASIYSTSVNFLGLPAGVFPIGFVDGLPMGLQIIGRRYREDLVLDAMEVIEKRVGVLSKELW